LIVSLEWLKELNSQLNRKVADHEPSLARGTHRLIEGDFNDPEPSGARHALDRTSDSSLPEFTRGEWRQRMLATALNRLQVEEEKMEQSYGTSGPAKVTPTVGAPAYVQQVALTQL
jgi:hypothetical protein